LLAFWRPELGCTPNRWAATSWLHCWELWFFWSSLAWFAEPEDHKASLALSAIGKVHLRLRCFSTASHRQVPVAFAHDLPGSPGWRCCHEPGSPVVGKRRSVGARQCNRSRLGLICIAMVAEGSVSNFCCCARTNRALPIFRMQHFGRVVTAICSPLDDGFRAASRPSMAHMSEGRECKSPASGDASTATKKGLRRCSLSPRRSVIFS